MSQLPGKNTDEALRDLFQSKLGNHESAVSDALWNNIEKALPGGGSAAAASSAAWKSIALWIAGAAAVVGVLVAVISNQNTTPQSTQQVAPSATTTSSSEDENSVEKENTSSQETHGVQTEQQSVNRPIPELPSGLTFQMPEVNKIDTYLKASWVKTPAQHFSAYAKTTGEEEQKNPIQEAAPISNPSFNANFTAAELNMGDMTYFFFPENTANVAYEWNFGDGTRSQEQSVNHSFSSPGVYDVELVTTDLANGQKASVKKIIEVLQPATIKAPNVFTPNADGANDTFDLLEMSIGIESIDMLQITSPSGKVVFEGNVSSWNGNDKSGEPCAEENYYYIVRAKTTDGKMLTRKGIVRLERN